MGNNVPTKPPHEFLLATDALSLLLDHGLSGSDRLSTVYLGCQVPTDPGEWSKRRRKWRFERGCSGVSVLPDTRNQQ